MLNDTYCVTKSDYVLDKLKRKRKEIQTKMGTILYMQVLQGNPKELKADAANTAYIASCFDTAIDILQDHVTQNKDEWFDTTLYVIAISKKAKVKNRIDKMYFQKFLTYVAMVACNYDNYVSRLS